MSHSTVTRVFEEKVDGWQCGRHASGERGFEGYVAKGRSNSQAAKHPT